MTVGQFVTKGGEDIHGPLRKNPTEFGDPSAFTPIPT